MVNVPGRSKGCNTCRRRKKGCDLQKPHCARCLKDNIHCDGYDRPMIFVDQGFSKKNSATTKGKAAGAVKTSSRSHQPRGSSKSLSIITNTLPPRHETKALIRGAWEEQYLSLYWQQSCPSGDRLSRFELPCLTKYTWAEAVIHLSKTSKVLHPALNAVCQAFVASKEGNSALSRYSFHTYGAGLQQVNKRLQDPKRVIEDDTILPACLFLAVFEQFNGFVYAPNSTQGKNWQAHSEGVVRLLLLRGPERHTSGISFDVYSLSRMPIFALYFGARKACPLASAEWLSIPFQNKQKSYKDLLFDLLIQVPGLLEQADIAEAVDSMDLRIITIHALLDMHMALRQWELDLFESLQSRFATLSTSTPKSDITLDDPKTFLSFGLDVAHAAATYWAVCMTIFSTINSLRSSLPPPCILLPVDSARGDSLNSLYNAILSHEEGLNPYPYALKVIQAIPYFIHPDSGLNGFQNIIFPIGIVLAFLLTLGPERTDDIKTIIGLLNESPTNGSTGLLIKQFLRQVLERGRNVQIGAVGRPLLLQQEEYQQVHADVEDYGDGRDTTGIEERHARKWFRLRAGVVN